MRVVRRDGTPARDVDVRVAGESRRTDADGRAQFAAIPLGSQRVLAVAHGYLPTFAIAEVGKDEEVALVEASPRRTRVRVIDPEGRAVPAVRVLATCRSAVDAAGSFVDVHTTVAQMEGDTEILTPRTDRDGFVLLDLPTGSIEFDATLVGAATEVTTANDDVQIVLSPPKPRSHER